MSQPQARHLVQEEEEAAKLAGHARCPAGKGPGQADGGSWWALAGRAQVEAGSSVGASVFEKAPRSHFNRVSVKLCQYPADLS